MIDFSTVRIVDLTDPLRTGMPVYPGDPEVQITQVLTIEQDGESVFEFQLSSQSGSHLQSGYYFLPDGQTLDQVNPASFFGWAKIIDIPNHLFSLKEIEHAPLDLQDVDFVVLRSGYGDKLKKITRDDVESPNRPRMSMDVAKWLVNAGIKLIGIDSFGLEPYSDFRVNKYLCRAGVLILEGLVNLFSLHKSRVFMIALPLHVLGTEGAPCRVLALEPNP
ncbi:MAG: cyclase family protein [Candidatus Heimdallarchaeota archaeon]